MVSEVTHEDRIFDHQLIAKGGMAYAQTIVDYKERLGITVLRKPAAGTQHDMCIVYKPVIQDGELTGYKPVEMSSNASALMGAIAKGFLLTPAGEEPQAEHPTVENVVPAVRADETHSDEPEEQPSPVAASADIEEDESSDSETELSVEAEQEIQYRCDRKWSNGKTCTKVYTNEKFYLNHIRDKHAK
jgi:hypothetical protein